MSSSISIFAIASLRHNLARSGVWRACRTSSQLSTPTSRPSSGRCMMPPEIAVPHLQDPPCPCVATRVSGSSSRLLQIMQVPWHRMCFVTLIASRLRFGSCTMHPRLHMTHCQRRCHCCPRPHECNLSSHPQKMAKQCGRSTRRRTSAPYATDPPPHSCQRAVIQPRQRGHPQLRHRCPSSSPLA
jgi:hypothetical protein